MSTSLVLRGATSFHSHVPCLFSLAFKFGIQFDFAQAHENGVGFVLALGIVTENPKVSLLFLLLPLPATEVMTLLLLRSQATLTLGQSADSQELYFKYMHNIKIVLTTLLDRWSIVIYAK